MKKILTGLSAALFILGFATHKDLKKTEKRNKNPSFNQKVKQMNSYISIFEIPATDISRAINFYQAILDIQIEKMEMPSMEMGILPYEDQMVVGIIVKGEDFKPSAEGPTLYLNGGDNLQTILDRVEKSNGKIIVPKTPHADESGFFALFIDTEGNKLGLSSPN